MPKESRRKSVTFVLEFSAEEDGPSGCQAISMTDSEQYYEKAKDKPKAVSMALPLPIHHEPHFMLRCLLPSGLEAVSSEHRRSL
jgi:hypothetical protein